MKPWTPTTVLQSSGPAREGGRTITANSTIPVHLYFIFFQYGPVSWEKTPPGPGTRRKKCRGGVGVLAWALPAPAIPLPQWPRESSLLPLPDNISPVFHSGRNLCRGSGLEIALPAQDEGRDGCGVKGEEFVTLAYNCFSFCLYKQSIIY